MLKRFYFLMLIVSFIMVQVFFSYGMKNISQAKESALRKKERYVIISSNRHFIQQVLSFFNTFIKSILCLQQNNIMLVSIPKSGTWMLDKCISLLTNRHHGLSKFFHQGTLRRISLPAAEAPKIPFIVIHPTTLYLILVQRYCLKNIL